MLLHTNLGLVRLREQGQDAAVRRTRATWAVALDLAAGAATRPFAELYGTGGERPQWQAGLRWQATEGLQLDFGFGAQAGRWSGTRQVNLGLVWVFPVMR